MALIVAQANGNFSSPSTWFDGVVPTVDDIVHSNTFTIQVDTDINVGRISNANAIPGRINPSMLNNTNPSGVCSASSNGTNAYLAFDGSNATTGNAWVSSAGSGSTGWVAYQFSATRRIVRYQIAFSVATTDLNQNPTAWQFQGSDDGITWTTLDTVTGFTPGAGTTYDSGTFTQLNTYLRYRLNVTAAGVGATQIRVGEFSMWEFGNNRTASIGGQFQITTPRTVTLTAVTPIGHGINTSTLLVNNNTGSTSVNTTNQLTGSFSLGAISHTGSGTLTVTSPTIGAAGSNNGTTIGRIGSGTLNIVGNLAGATGGAANTTLVNSSGGTINITGNVISGNSNNTSTVITNSLGDVIITGNVDGGTALGTTGVAHTSGTLTINGTVTGGTQVAINNQSLCSINGNVSTIGANPGVISTVAATTNVVGNANASATGNAIYITNAGGVLNFTGNITNSGQRQAICSTTIRLSDALPSFWQASTVTNAAKIFYTADTFPNTPVVGNVRQGTTYGPGSSLTGTLAVPSPSNVLSGVPTDNTVGTYSTTPTQIATEIFTKLLSDSDFSTAGSFGKLVKDNLDATVSSRSTQTSVDAIPTNPLLTTDSRLNNLDATISSRLASASYVAPANSDITAIKAKTDNLPSDPASDTTVNTRLAAASYVAPDNATIGTINTKLGTPVSSVSADIASVKSDSSGLRTDYTTGRAANLDNLDATVSSRLASASYVAPSNSDIAAIKAKTDNLPADPASDTTVNTRLASASYVAPANADIAAIKAKTDNLPSDPADNSDILGAISAIPSAPSATTVATAVRTELTTELGRIDVTTSSRLASVSYVAPDNASVTAIKAKTDNLPSDPADNSDILGAISAIPGSATPSQIATAVRTELTPELGRIDVNTSTRLATASYVAPANGDITAIKAKTDNLPSDPADNSDILSAIAAIPPAPSSTTVASAVRTELTTELNRIDANVSSRLASASYTAPDNASITGIKSKTDNLPADPASDTNVNTKTAEIKQNTDLIPAAL